MWVFFTGISHDDVIKWKQFPRYWPFVRGIHRSPVNSPHKGQWRGVLMFSLICARINGWVNNREAGDLRRYRCHYDVIVMSSTSCTPVVGMQHIVKYLGYQFIANLTYAYNKLLDKDRISWWLRTIIKPKLRAFVNMHDASPCQLLKLCDSKRDGVWNHRHLDCLLNRLFMCRSKKSPKLRIIGLWAGNSPMTDVFPSKGQ